MWLQLFLAARQVVGAATGAETHKPNAYSTVIGAWSLNLMVL